jgi:hypothetical protein
MTLQSDPVRLAHVRCSAHARPNKCGASRAPPLPKHSYTTGNAPQIALRILEKLPQEDT